MTEQIFTVDLERHNDGEGGLVGPFPSRAAAEQYVESIADDFVRRWATIRPVVSSLQAEETP